MDLMPDHYETATLEGWLEPEPEPDADGPIDEEHVWFSMSRVGYDADAFDRIEREPEFDWFG